jgi:hypothetical protein
MSGQDRVNLLTAQRSVGQTTVRTCSGGLLRSANLRARMAVQIRSDTLYVTISRQHKFSGVSEDRSASIFRV